MFLAGEPPEVQGAALAQMVATFLMGHRIKGDSRSTLEMQESILAQLMKTVRDIVLIHEAKGTEQ
jgi:hypothetical protein